MIGRGIFVLAVCAIIPAAQAGLVATYNFHNDLTAQQGGVVSLVAVDPMGMSGFQNVNVFGNMRDTYHFDGGTSPLQQGGLQLDTTGLVGANNYSVEMVFSLADRDAAWRRILDTQDRASDNGLYIDPNNHLDVYPVTGGGDAFAPNTFVDLFITVDGANNVVTYFGGVAEVWVNSSALDISTNYLNFFLDNVVGGGTGEWSGGNVALIKVWNSALSAEEVLAATEDPTGTGTPEAATWLLMAGGMALVAYRKLRQTA